MQAPNRNGRVNMEYIAHWVRVVTTPLVETKFGKWILSALNLRRSVIVSAYS
jgi:hypothetical protein